MDFITCLRPESVPRNKPDIVCMNNRTIYFWIQPLPVKKYDDLEGRIAHNTLPDLHNYVRHIILSLLSLIQQSLINKSRVWLGLKAFFTEFLWIYYHQLTIIAKFCLHLGQRTNWLQISMTPDPRALLCVTAREDELWGTLEQDSLRLVSTATTKKKKQNKKVVLIDPFKFARERLNVRRVWLEIGFFPINIEVNTPSWWATPAHSWFSDSKRTFARLITGGPNSVGCSLGLWCFDDVFWIN